MKKIFFNNHYLSELSLGTVQFGLDYGVANKGGKPNPSDVNSIIDYLYKNEINIFDTAQSYGNAEIVLGKTLEKKEKKYIISKLSSTDFLVREKIETSLKNLKIKKLFGLLLHDTKIFDNWSKEEDNYVKNLKNHDLITYFGTSIYSNAEFDLSLNNDSVDIIQVPFSLFDQRAIRYNWFEKAKQKNKLLIVRSIYLQGLLLMDIDNVPFKLSAAKKYINILDEFCVKNKLSRQELIIGYVKKRTTGAIKLFGCENIKQAKENINIYNKNFNLRDSELELLENYFTEIDETIWNPSKW